MRFKISGLLCLASVIAGSAGADVITVGPGGKFDYSTISAAIDAAGNYDEIVVAPGTYHELVNPHGKRIEIRSSSGPAVTAIDGGDFRRCIEFTKGETKDTVVEGFTIRDGRSGAYQPGGGIYIRGASPRIVNCQIVQCSAMSHPYYPGDGGAVYVDIGFPAFENCYFGQCEGNNGGGLCLVNFSQVIVQDCIFEGNAAQKGGGVYLEDNSSATMTSCEFISNSASWYGGGIYMLDGCAATLIDCDISSCQSLIGGGGVFCQCGILAMDGGTVELCESEIGGGVNINCGFGTINNMSFGNNLASTGADIRIDGSPPPPRAPIQTQVGIGGTFFCGSPDPIDGPYNDLGGNSFFLSCTDGACCSNGICAIADGAICVSLGGEFKGVGVFCEDANCPGDCPGDTNGDGIVGTDDILTVISGWGPCP
ncbi:MAG: hypothetical protein GY894_06295 [Planctomycetes bacterium]|nr:hypothetical protein [Planctomycetota bacterium]MCP4838954.1 hypothetical protein [Planctomycetota bacterium]